MDAKEMREIEEALAILSAVKIGVEFLPPILIQPLLDAIASILIGLYVKSGGGLKDLLEGFVMHVEGAIGKPIDPKTLEKIKALSKKDSWEGVKEWIKNLPEKKEKKDPNKE